VFIWAWSLNLLEVGPPEAGSSSPVFPELLLTACVFDNQQNPLLGVEVVN